jgi:hypothetical protein
MMVAIAASASSTAEAIAALTPAMPPSPSTLDAEPGVIGKARELHDIRLADAAPSVQTLLHKKLSACQGLDTDLRPIIIKTEWCVECRAAARLK